MVTRWWGAGRRRALRLWRRRGRTRRRWRRRGRTRRRRARCGRNGANARNEQSQGLTYRLPPLPAVRVDFDSRGAARGPWPNPRSCRRNTTACGRRARTCRRAPGGLSTCATLPMDFTAFSPPHLDASSPRIFTENWQKSEDVGSLLYCTVSLYCTYFVHNRVVFSQREVIARSVALVCDGFAHVLLFCPSFLLPFFFFVIRS